MYKKILSLALVLLMVFSCFALSVSAYTPSLESVCEDAFINYLKKTGATYDEPVAYFNYLGDAGCLVFQAAAFPGDPVEPTDVIGDYRFTAFRCMGYCDTNPAGMYAYKDGELMTLKDAYDKGLVDLDLLYEQSDKNYVMTRLSEEEILENKCREAYIKEFDVPDSFEFPVAVDFAVEFPNYTVFRAYHQAPPEMETHQYIDGYWFYTPCILGNDDYNTTGIYTLDNYGNVQSLAETVSEGFIETDEIFEAVSAKCEMHLSGDIDSDKRLTVKDATLIQKYLAKVPEAVKAVNSHHLGAYVMDFELNFATTPEVNIKDATYIQKKVAKMLWEDDRQSFVYDEILVFANTEDEKVYTLEDFPEYEFESIERAEYATYMYILKLKNYGKENVIDAVNSLKYREGVEFKYVQPNYLYYFD